MPCQFDTISCAILGETEHEGTLPCESISWDREKASVHYNISSTRKRNVTLALKCLQSMTYSDSQCVRSNV